ncbi:TraR/DksA C4-type zinc finger protein [Isoptericola sp. b441]|uniref:TraR/DksA C4-type zinc finger protein n=1 Tax=Actinotalea lenta TaxID=3064654 RepID=A0ABT9D950_9CELL|nr:MULTISPECIES: TraR/DksA C4-type zinc finger protein [unclassified Isoptericola]MDO8107435.1 TraR/DksA C4-type zinc finger protein [Isoptericola sp. b441]MDO8120903.1 TraR/DksA C4-type zinc finger protein [Isoptericola sp. b490]
MAIQDPVSASGRARPSRSVIAGIVDTFPVRDGEDPWTVEEVESLADDLASEISRLTVELSEADAELTSLLRYSGDGAGDDQADSGSSALEREQELTMLNNTKDLLDQNVRALERVGQAGFGTCESCGGAIGKARLQAFPRATFCVTCKAKQERR